MPLPIRGYKEITYPDYADAALAASRGNFPGGWETFGGVYKKTMAKLDETEENGARHRLLGWPNIIQNNMTQECELVSRGHFRGNTWDGILEADRLTARQTSLEAWRLPFQLDSFEKGDLSLDFGDCGSIYYYIRTEDLTARRFDRVWLIRQCY